MYIGNEIVEVAAIGRLCLMRKRCIDDWAGTKLWEYFGQVETLVNISGVLSKWARQRLFLNGDHLVWWNGREVQFFEIEVCVSLSLWNFYVRSERFIFSFDANFLTVIIRPFEGRRAINSRIWGGIDASFSPVAKGDSRAGSSVLEEVMVGEYLVTMVTVIHAKSRSIIRGKLKFPCRNNLQFSRLAVLYHEYFISLCVCVPFPRTVKIITIWSSTTRSA